MKQVALEQIISLYLDSLAKLFKLGNVIFETYGINVIKGNRTEAEIEVMNFCLTL